MSGILKTISIGLSLCTAFTIIFLFTIFAPKLCKKSSAFYTTLAGVITLLLWQLIPSFRIFPHVIFMEWLVCLITFMLTSTLDKRSIMNIETIDKINEIV